MTLSVTEKIAANTTHALYEAIQVAWQAGYDTALKDIQEAEERIRQQVAGDIGE
jgi:cellobiose-specific phosphotransferase system component IIA